MVQHSDSQMTSDAGVHMKGLVLLKSLVLLEDSNEIFTICQSSIQLGTGLSTGQHFALPSIGYTFEKH